MCDFILRFDQLANDMRRLTELFVYDNDFTLPLTEAECDALLPTTTDAAGRTLAHRYHRYSHSRPWKVIASVAIVSAPRVPLPQVAG